MATKDKYGIPLQGNSGPYTAKKWKGISHTLSWEELMACIAMGGWPETLWGTAGAVAAAESSRNPFIYNTYKRGHFGLFQISRSDHADFFTPNGEGMQWTAPWANAKEGYAIYRSQGWGAWQAKTSGAYLAFYPAAMEAAANLQRKTGAHGGDKRAFWNSLISQKTFGYVLKAMDVSGADIAAVANQGVGEAIVGAADATAQGTVDSGSAVASSVGDMAQVVTGAWTALTTPALWMRLGYGALGVVLVAGGLFLIVRQRPAVQAAVNTVSSTVPGGAALKAVKGGKAA